MQDATPSREIDSALAAAYPKTFRYAYMLTGNPLIAEDLTQTAMIRVLARIRQTPIEHLAAYLRRCVANEFIRHSRRRREFEHEQSTSQSHNVAIPFTDQVADRSLIVYLLQHLTPKERTVVVSRYYLDLSERDTAQLMGCTTGSVKTLAHRGLTKLRTRLAAHEGTSEHAISRTR